MAWRNCVHSFYGRGRSFFLRLWNGESNREVALICLTDTPRRTSDRRCWLRSLGSILVLLLCLLVMLRLLKRRQSTRRPFQQMTVTGGVCRLKGIDVTSWGQGDVESNGTHADPAREMTVTNPIYRGMHPVIIRLSHFTPYRPVLDVTSFAWRGHAFACFSGERQ